MEDITLRFAFTPYSLMFKEPSGTSRGVMYEKNTFFLKCWTPENPNLVAYGEVPFFPGLSKETPSELISALTDLVSTGDWQQLLQANCPSSLKFGLEQVINSLQNPNLLAFPSDFTKGESTIQINGLIWMGSFGRMKQRALDKIKEDFKCIKIKIGAINWEDELELIRFVRDVGGSDIIIRVDANGGFTVDDCLYRLEQLATYSVHSIEQPIAAGNWKDMKYICQNSPIPVALDEELIGIPPGTVRTELIEYIRPQFLILKPALCYGFSGASDWISLVKKHNIGFWITSALESSVGLDAIAQFTGKLNPEIPQGLGTGNLFLNNFPSKLSLLGDKLEYLPNVPGYEENLEKLSWRYE